MRFGNLVLAAVLALGLGGAASAASTAPSPAEVIDQPGVAVEYAKRKGHRGWSGHRGRHYGWYRGRHRGWDRPHRRVYYAPQRHYRPAYYGYRPRAYDYGYYPRRRSISIHF